MYKVMKCISLSLILIGALNWGLFGLFKMDLVSMLLGEMSVFSRIIYILIGLSAIIYGSLLYICKDDYQCA